MSFVSYWTHKYFFIFRVEFFLFQNMLDCLTKCNAYLEEEASRDPEHSTQQLSLKLDQYGP
jgi:hypothetical protein